jgi:hypothetical protein
MRTKSKAVALLTLALAAPLAAQQARKEALPAGTCDGAPVYVVAQFLGLAPEQTRALVQLLHERQAALVPIQHEIAAREQRIQELIAAGGDPAEIGRLVLEIHQLQQAAAAAQAQFLMRFGALLTEDQRSRWQGIQAAARLQPILPAFQALQML